MNALQQTDKYSHNQVGIVLKVVLNIFEQWGCTVEQKVAILGLTRTTFYRVKKAPEKATLSHDQVERMSYVLNIHQALRMVFSNTENIYGYMSMTNNNPYFNGQTPLSIIEKGAFGALYEVYKRIDAMRSGQW